MDLADPFGITPYKSSYLIINMNQNIINSRLLISPLHSARRLPKSILHFFFRNLLPIFHGLLRRVTVQYSSSSPFPRDRECSAYRSLCASFLEVAWTIRGAEQLTVHLIMAFVIRSPGWGSSAPENRLMPKAFEIE